MNWVEGYFNMLELAYKELKEEISKLQNQLKEERRGFDLLEKSVDQSNDANAIFRRFHQYKNAENSIK